MNKLMNKQTIEVWTNKKNGGKNNEWSNKLTTDWWMDETEQQIVQYIEWEIDRYIEWYIEQQNDRQINSPEFIWIVPKIVTYV